MKIIVIGDIIVKPEMMLEAVQEYYTDPSVEIKTFSWDMKDRQEFQRRAQNIELNGPSAEEVPEEIYEEIKDADAIFTHFCPVSKELLSKAENLKLIATCRGGTEHLAVEEATNIGIPVINTIRNAEATSDFTIGLIYAEARNIAKGHRALMNGKWEKNYPNLKFTKHINELVIGIIGLGSIGKLVAKKANLLGMEVLAYDPFVSEDDIEGLNIKKLDDIKDVFRTSDFVSIHLRSTPQTENMINAELINEMPKTSYLINTSRATVVNKEDLYASLENHSIGGAALDVFWEEPISEDDPILTFDNVTLTPHLAGNVVEALPRSPFMMIENIKDFIENKQLNRAVNSKSL